MTEVAKMLASAERFEEAAVWYRRLAEKYPDVVCLDGMTGRQVIASLPASGRMAQALSAHEPWPSGRVKVQHSTSNTTERRCASFNRLASQQSPLEIRQADGTLPDGASLVISRQLDSIGVVDRTGQLQQYVTLEQSENQLRSLARSNQASYAKLQGHLLLVSLMGGEIVAINMLAPDAVGGMEVLWREDLSSQLPGLALSRSRLQARPQTTPWVRTRQVATEPDGKPVGAVGTVTEQGVCYQAGRELRCVDPYTNQLLWTAQPGGSGLGTVWRPAAGSGGRPG